MAEHLPDCMMPDGAEPCLGFQETLAELTRVQVENARLRAALAQSKGACVYCSLPAEEWAKCKDGFPGCARADDAVGCPELGASLALKALEELQRQWDRSRDLRWKADRRATKRWQEAHPGNDLVWPDHADMVVWLLEQLDSARKAIEFVTSRFEASEAQGYHTKDRAFAIEVLRKFQPKD